jgi:hypothetical protein
MIEVFRTNVKDRSQANMLINQIHKSFGGYTANFDLEDCDRILRVTCTTGLIQASYLIHLLNGFGYTAEVLPDDLHERPIINQ